MTTRARSTGTGSTRAAGSTGTSLTELLLSTALIGIVATISAPAFHSYLHAGALKAGAEELAALMNLARSLAIRDNTRVCVNRDPEGSNRVRLLIASANPCAAEASFYGSPGRGVDARVDTGGWIALQNQVGVTAATADVIFTALGAAVPGGTYTVSKNGRTLDVVVAPTGRVTIAP
jgi:Tfp pilus assembly protein FimT